MWKVTVESTEYGNALYVIGPIIGTSTPLGTYSAPDAVHAPG